MRVRKLLWLWFETENLFFKTDFKGLVRLKGMVWFNLKIIWLSSIFPNHFPIQFVQKKKKNNSVQISYCLILLFISIQLFLTPLLHSTVASWRHDTNPTGHGLSSQNNIPFLFPSDILFLVPFDSLLFNFVIIIWGNE